MGLKIGEPNKYGTLDTKGLADFENHNQITIPNDYKVFLKKTNGGAPIYDVEMHELDEKVPQVGWFYGFHEGPSFTSIYYALEMYTGRLPSWYFPIAEDHSGNLFLMSLYEENYGLITFWNHEGENLEGNAEQHFDNMHIIADNFSKFEKMF
jgi:hypothetical protein